MYGSFAICPYPLSGPDVRHREGRDYDDLRTTRAAWRRGQPVAADVGVTRGSASLVTILGVHRLVPSSR